MSLPWFRVDSHIGSHDKVLNLLSIEGAKPADRWQASFSYICAIGWAVDHGTDGKVPKIALPFVHGTPTTARLLVISKLWIEHATGWEIVNFANRQELTIVTDEKRSAQSAGGKAARCRNNHGLECGCNYSTKRVK